MEWELGLPEGTWVVVAKAWATGAPLLDCKLLTQSVDPAARLEVDDIEVRTDTGPVTVVLTGIVVANATVPGVNLVCSSTSGVTAAMGRIRLVATHVAAGFAF